MKYTNALFFMFMFCTSCGQNKTDLPKENIKCETKDTVTSYGPSSMVRNVKQARNGDILIAAFNGVFRYDGTSFTNLTSKISSPSFWDVLEDRKGNLWFATRDSGVYYYNGKSQPTGQAGFRHFTTKDGLPVNQALHIYEDRAGNIWFASGAGASRYDGKSFKNFKIKDVPPPTDADSIHVSDPLPEVHWMHNCVNSIIEDKTGKFWLGTNGYACIYDGKTFTTLTNKDGKPFRNVRSIIEDKKGNIWLGGNDGLWRYDGSTFTNFTQNFVGYIYEDKKGNIWTSSENANGKGWALSRYDEKSLYNKEPTVTEIMSTEGPGMLCGILEAEDGSIWFGALGSIISGVFRYDGKTITDFRSKEDQK